MSKEKKKRTAETAFQSTASLSSLREITSLQDCYNFVSPNEYSNQTFGLLAFLLRKTVGDINFSDILDEVEKHGQDRQAADFIGLLENKRDNIKEIDASIEKCLIITRLISYIQENKTDFMTTVSHIRFDMKVKMTDNQINQMIQYPNDFRQRELDVVKRKNAQDMRRLFYRSHIEAKEPPSIIHLQNRTTDHLTYLIDHRMKYESKFRDTGLNEIFNILNNSFMIIAQPHSGVNPVLIYDREKPGIYTAKLSVIIVSLLHDFMQTHPNMIEFYNIEPSLCPSSPHYKLSEPQSISWQTCHLQACLGSKPQIIQYAELLSITIQQTCAKDTRVHFAQALHSLKFVIKSRVNLTEYRFTKIHQITLESLSFAIGQHNNQIPQLLTRVILDDIKRFSECQSNDVRRIAYFILCYFIHRTGVEPKQDLKIYLCQELSKAMNARKNFQTLEDIYMDFLVPFVYQVEFMGKHPILAMFYAEGLFLGPCNSALVAEIMKKPSDVHSPKVGLRFNSIEVNYTVIATKSVAGRTIKLNACAVRVDIYKNPTQGVQNLTFDSTTLATDISKFVSSSPSKTASRIYILSNLNEKTNDKIYKSYGEFSKYYHDRLHEICKPDGKYKAINNVLDNINGGDYEEIHNDEENQIADLDESSQPTASISPTTFDNDYNVDTNTVSAYRLIPYDDHNNNNEASSQNVLSLSKQQLIRYVLSDPELFTELMHQMSMLNFTAPTQQQSPFVIGGQFQEQMTYQQQQRTPHIHLCQPAEANQTQICYMNGIDNGSQQSSTQDEIFETSEDDLTQSTADLLELLTTYQISPIPTDQDLQQSFDELLTDILSSQNDQKIITFN